MIVSGTGVEMEFPIGENLWHYTISTSYDNSPKGIVPIQDINVMELLMLLLLPKMVSLELSMEILSTMEIYYGKMKLVHYTIKIR